LRTLLGEDADDVQQEVWLTVYRNIGSLTNPGAFRTWLFRTTRNRAIDFLRRRKRQQELVDEALAFASEANEPDDPDTGKIDEAVLDQALAELPVLLREAMLLRYRDDMSYAEIALVVGCPIGTVRTRLHHAKRRLEKRLQRGDL
jgi:RNA polymerase sigma-70 factor (ECF subfamily)